MVYQLRIYQINPNLKEEFSDRFKSHAIRIMKKYNFEIVAMWFSEFDGKTEFIYILKWLDKDTMQKQWNAFMSDQEWENIKLKSREENGEMVLAKLRDQTLDSLDWFENKI